MILIKLKVKYVLQSSLFIQNYQENEMTNSVGNTAIVQQRQNISVWQSQH